MSYNAIILAGGQGVRLSPLTKSMPKPLLPINNTPVIGHILDLLNRHGVVQTTIMAGYMADKLQNAIGNKHQNVRVKYYVEETPLGTAGCIKRAFDSTAERAKSPMPLGDHFLVMCGDAFTNIDLTEAYNFHLKQGGIATVIITQVKNPLEYGLVTANDSGRILAFNEKPGWGGVTGNMANTGIYLFRRDILDFIPDQKYDFGRELFTQLLDKNIPIYAYESKDFWCDVGDFESYYNCNMNQSDGGNVFSEGCEIHESALVKSSLFGHRVIASENCTIESSIIWDDCVIGKGAIIGEGCVIGANCIISDGVRVPAGTVLDQGSVTLARTTVEGDQATQKLKFDEQCITVDCKTEDKQSLRLGTAIAGAIGEGSSVGIISDGSEQATAMLHCLTMGLHHGGAIVFDEGVGFAALAAYAARERNYDMTIYVAALPEENTGESGNNKASMYLFDSNGMYPGVVFERKIASQLPGQKIRTDKEEQELRYAGDVSKLYASELEKIMRIDSVLPLPQISLMDNPPSRLFSLALEGAGVTVAPGGEYKISFAPDGMSCEIYHGENHYDFWHLLGLVISAKMEEGVKTVALPYRSPSAVIDMIHDRGGEVLFYSLSPATSNEMENTARKVAAAQPWSICGIALAAQVLALVARREESLTKLSESLPKFGYVIDMIDVREESKIAVIKDGGKPAVEGVVEDFDVGKVRMVARAGRGVSLYAEAANMDDAAQLILLAKRKIVERLEG